MMAIVTDGDFDLRHPRELQYTQTYQSPISILAASLPDKPVDKWKMPWHTFSSQREVAHVVVSARLVARAVAGLNESSVAISRVELEVPGAWASDYLGVVAEEVAVTLNETIELRTSAASLQDIGSRLRFRLDLNGECDQVSRLWTAVDSEPAEHESSPDGIINAGREAVVDLLGANPWVPGRRGSSIWEPGLDDLPDDAELLAELASEFELPEERERHGIYTGLRVWHLSEDGEEELVALGEDGIGAVFCAAAAA